MKSTLKINSGFTLIEVIIYIALLSIIMYGALVTSFQLLEGSDALEVRATVQEEGNFVLRKIDWALANMDSNNLPSIGGTNCNQSIMIHKINYTDTVEFYLKTIGNQKYIYIKEGVKDLPLTTENVAPSCLKFQMVGTDPIGVIATATISGKDFTITKYLHK